MIADNGDFSWEGRSYRPNDLFRVKVLGMFPKVSDDVLVPYEWVEAANTLYPKRTNSNAMNDLLRNMI